MKDSRAVNYFGSLGGHAFELFSTTWWDIVVHRAEVHARPGELGEIPLSLLSEFPRTISIHSRSYKTDQDLLGNSDSPEKPNKPKILDPPILPLPLPRLIIVPPSRAMHTAPNPLGRSFIRDTEDG